MLLDSITRPPTCGRSPTRSSTSPRREIRDVHRRRRFAQPGGHLGSNLGAVELTLAVHRVFDSPRDIVLWDTGHQAYVHKILTGRRDEFATLRQEGGLSGYPSPSRVRARLDREQPRLDRRQLRPRPRHRPGASAASTTAASSP